MNRIHALRLGLVAATALAVACGSNNGGSDAGTNTGTDAGANTQTDAGPTTTTYCDGIGATDSSGDLVLVDTYSFGGTLKFEGCSTTVDGYADGTALTQVGGIYELITENGANAGVLPGNCSDLGLSGFTAPTATTITPPTGVGTVSAALAPLSTGGTPSATSLYGVVTAVYEWSNGVSDAGTGDAHSGTIYVQDATTADGTAAPYSGVEVYFPKSADGVAVTGSTSGRLEVGDVVAFTGLKWSPYPVAPPSVDQFEASAASTATWLGTSPLPAAVSLTPAEIGTTSLASPKYEGMRVTVSGSFTVKGSETSGDCPAGVTDTSSG